MALRDLARTFQAAQSGLIGVVRTALAAVWATINPDDLAGSWASTRAGERAYVAISSYQQLAAAGADQWVRDALADQGVTPADRHRARAHSFAGRSSDGALLEPRLAYALSTVRYALQRGKTLDEAMSLGGRALEMIGATEVSDAARLAAQATLTGEETATGWIRLVNLPACGRCVSLAGDELDWDDPIKAHPSCDCGLAPSAKRRARDLLVDPLKHFESLPPAEQDRRFGPGPAQDIRDGARPATAVGIAESSSGLYVVGTEHPQSTGPTVRSLLDRARGDRDEAIRLLGEHGFLL